MMSQLGGLMVGRPTSRDPRLAKYNIPDVSAEYAKLYPNEKERIAELEMNIAVREKVFGDIEAGGNAFSQEDFAPEPYRQRWAIKDMDDLQDLKKFLKREDLDDGDIWNRKKGGSY